MSRYISHESNLRADETVVDADNLTGYKWVMSDEDFIRDKDEKLHVRRQKRLEKQKRRQS